MIRLKFSPQRISWTILLFICVGYIITLVNDNVELGSKFFAAEFVIAVICILWGIVYSRYKSLNDPFWLGVLIVLFACINVFTGSAGNMSLGYFAKVLRFGVTVMLIYFCTKYKAGKIIIRYFGFANQILALALIYQGFIIKDTYFIYTTLTLGFPNPNPAGIWSALCICGIIWSFSCLKSKAIKAFYLAETGVLVYLLIRTECRSALISVCGLIIAIVFINIKAKRKGIKALKKTLYKTILVIICFFPLMFSVIYMGIFYANISFDKVGGKDFYSGREILWYSTLQNLKSHYITGAYNAVSYGTGQSQLHNIYIDIMGSYGVVVFTLFLIFMLWIVLRQLGKLNTIQQYIAFLAFLMMFFIGGTFEAAYVSGDSGINYWTCLFLLFANAYGESSKDNAFGFMKK